VTDAVSLTDSQADQLRTFLQEHEHRAEVDLRPVPTLPEGYIEAVLLDSAGEETAAKEGVVSLAPSGSE
jgi:hypothetical protein